VISRATEKPSATAPKDRRLRVVYRRELQNSVYNAALIVGVGIAIAALASLPIGAQPPPGYFLLVVPLVVAAFGVLRTVRRGCRRYVVQLGMLVGLLPFAATLLGVWLIPQDQIVALSSLGLMPLAFAIFIPLDRGANSVWLGLANTIVIASIAVMAATGAPPSYEIAALFAAILGSALSLGANDIQLRRRHEMNGQLISVRGLYSRMKEHEQDLRRQDEFLFMQQETLVVQQAELLRLNEELETIARLDALTGLGNRLRLNEDLAAVAARIERHGGTAGLLLLDLDRFKRLNDSAGHLAGDAALRGVADSLRKTSRQGDGVYRYGGEEFLVILHDCDEAALYAAGQRYLTAIQAAGMAHPDNPPYGLVTASAGATELSQANCTDVDSALHDADEALYVAKESGRNRLHVSVRPGPADVVQINRQRAAS